MLQCIVDSELGPESIIRSHSVIYPDCKLGARLHVGHGVLIREENIIGEDVSIGSHTTLEPGNVIGDRVRIHSNCFLSGTHIANDVWIGPNVVFTDDPHPPCPEYVQCHYCCGARVYELAKIGANCTILPGVTIGVSALVGAGSVVVDDVADGTVVVGNPARQIRILADLKCPAGFFKYPYQWEEENA